MSNGAKDLCIATAITLAVFTAIGGVVDSIETRHKARWDNRAYCRECDSIIWSTPTAAVCPECGSVAHWATCREVDGEVQLGFIELWDFLERQGPQN